MPRVSSSVDVKRIGWPQIYLGVGFTTIATLVLELSLNRVVSVVFFYRFAFLAISMALFGLAAGGVFSYVVVARKGSFFVKLGALAALNSVAVVLSLIFLLTRRGEIGNITLALICFATALPFFLSGIVVSLVVAETVQRVDRIYFFHLLGASVGCLALAPFLNYLGGPNTVIAAAVLFAVSSAIWFHCAGSVTGRAAAVVLALVLVAIVAYNGRSHVIDIHYAKGRDLPPEIFSKWNSFSRVGLSAGKTIAIDADPAGDIAQSDQPMAPGFPYLIRPGAKTLVIQPGGGEDVARALFSGSNDITAVEINPVVANTIMGETYAGFSHGLFLRPEVHVYVEDGRSFVRRSTSKYQVLQVDAWIPPSALSPNNLYTTDAFRDYLTHLTDDGLLAFNSSGLSPSHESLRLLPLASQAFKEIGEPDLASHFVVLRGGGRDTLLIFRKPITPDDQAKIRSALEQTKIELVYAPFVTGNTAALSVSPLSDDRPFFYYSRPLPLLFGAVAIGILATAAILLLPPRIFKTRLPVEKGLRSFICYFVCLGAGYILIQFALIHKFILLLGHPTYALTVILFSILISSALGSLYSRRVTVNASLIGIAALAATLAFIAAPIGQYAVGLPLPARILITVLLIAPVGFLMGVPFPAGLTWLETRYLHAVRWAWALNAAAGALASAAAIFLAIYLGLRATLLIGGGLHLVALLLALIDATWRTRSCVPRSNSRESTLEVIDSKCGAGC